jgi:hypothetical protein
MHWSYRGVCHGKREFLLIGSGVLRPGRSKQIGLHSRLPKTLDRLPAGAELYSRSLPNSCHEAQMLVQPRALHNTPTLPILCPSQ